MSYLIIDPQGLAGGDLTLPTIEAARNAVASMPASYGLYILFQTVLDAGEVTK